MTSVTEFTSAAVTDRGLNESRPQNEDSYLELAQHGLFAVADGVGGAQAGEVASQMAVEILGEAFINMGDADPEDTMRIALERANQAIYQMSRDLPQLSSMATTVVVLHLSGDIATIAHVGDSRIYRVDPNGRLFRETDDHSVVEEEVRAGRMTPEQALNHPSRNVISRALGAEDTVEPDIKCVLVHPATTFLLCSDGITRHIDDAEIESLLNSDFGPDDICARMKDICFSRGAEDNLTAVIVHFPGERLSMVDTDDDEIEEVTLAGIRDLSPAEADTDEVIEIPAEAAAAADSAETIDEGHEEEKEDDEAAYLIDEDEPFYPDDNEGESASLPAEMAEPAAQVAADVRAATTVSSYEYEPENVGTGSFGKVLSVLGLLIAGAAIGLAGGYFFLTKPQPVAQVPVIANQKSDNISLTSFEDTRRLVDEDPVKYLNAKAASPQNADDYFWLGRALLLTGKSVEARRAFEEAATRLPSFDDRSSARTMTNEIAMAFAIVDDEQAREAFAKRVAVGSAADGSNANSNAASNIVNPAR